MSVKSLLVADRVGDSVKISVTVYGNEGYAQLYRVGESLYLLSEQWCGGGLEGLCYRWFAARVPVSDEAALLAAFAAEESRAVRRFVRSLSGIRLWLLKGSTGEALRAAVNG